MRNNFDSILNGTTMHNFLRALKLTLKYKWNIVGVFVSALLLAVCWGGNIATVYPLVQVSFQGDSIQSWLEKEIVEQEELVRRLESERFTLLGSSKEEELSDSEISERLRTLSSEVRTNYSRTALRLENARKLLRRYQTFQPYVVRWTPNDPFLTVVMLMIFVLVATFIKSACTFVHSFLSSRIGQLGSFELRALFFRKMLGYEANYFSQRGVSDATSRFASDMSALSNGLTLTYGKALREPLKMIACVVGAALVSWQLLLFTFLFVPLAAVLVRWLAKSLRRVARRAMIQMAQLYSRIDETFRAIRVVKSFNGEDCEIAKFREANKTYFSRSMKMAKYDSITSPLTECLGIGMLILAIIAGAYLVIYEKTRLFGIPTSSRPLDLGSLILFYGFLIGAADPARRLTDIFTSIQSACAAADRVYEIIDREPLVTEIDSPKRLQEFGRTLTFEDVGYEYPVENSISNNNVEFKKVRFEDVLKKLAERMLRRIRKSSTTVSEQDAVESRINAKDITSESKEIPSNVDSNLVNEGRRVLNHVSFELKYGETVAILGRSGCGKSTLISMIPRFIDPEEGRVLMDGVSLRELKISDIREQIGLVSQDSVLFNDTVFENIRYGRPNASREEVITAAKEAYADDFIRNELANGYETIVGTGGGALSGGQRQRIALARALLKDPRIFILDEATSQIDLQSERYIHKALKNFIGNRLTIMVTHRLGAIQLADRIIVMQDGAVQFIGTHDEALKQSSFYAGLWASEENLEDEFDQ